MSDLKGRNKLLDIAKGLLIYLVILGHTLQYMKGEAYLNSGEYFNNFLFKIIYSFHMPLFIMISGFLIGYSINKYSSKELIIKKFKALITPILVCSTLEIVLLYIFKGDISFKDIIYNFLNSLWFLWAVFYCSLIVILNKNIFNDSKIVYIGLFVPFLIFPNYFHKDLYGYMYFYFILGYFFNKHYKCILKKFDNKWILIACLYLILMLFWNKESYIYTTGITIYKSDDIIFTLLNDLYRYIVGLLGSILILKGLTIIKTNIEFLAKFGQKSLGIYIINTYLSIYLLTKIEVFSEMNTIIYIIVCFIVSIFILIISYYFVKLIEKNKTLSKLFLGKFN